MHSPLINFRRRNDDDAHAICNIHDQIKENFSFCFSNFFGITYFCKFGCEWIFENDCSDDERASTWTTTCLIDTPAMGEMPALRRSSSIAS
jgi:hypothetical protein